MDRDRAVSHDQRRAARGPRGARAVSVSRVERPHVCASWRPDARVYFFSLDAGSAVAAAAARTLFDLPYFAASMTLVRDAQTVRFASRRNAGADSAACFIASYEPDGRVFHAQTGSLDYFLTERYCLYTVDRARRPHRLDIHHPPWPLQRGVATIQTNTMAQANAIALPAVAAPLLHFAVRQDVVAWLPVRPDGY